MAILISLPRVSLLLPSAAKMPAEAPRKRKRTSAAATTLGTSAALSQHAAAAEKTGDGSDGADDGRFDLAGDGFSDEGADEPAVIEEDVDEAPEGPNQLSKEALLEYKAKADRTGCVRRSDGHLLSRSASSTSRASRPAWARRKLGISCRSTASSVASSSSAMSAVRRAELSSRAHLDRRPALEAAQAEASVAQLRRGLGRVRRQEGRAARRRVPQRSADWYVAAVHLTLRPWTRVHVLATPMEQC